MNTIKSVNTCYLLLSESKRGRNNIVFEMSRRPLGK